MAHGHRANGQRSPTYQSWRMAKERCRREGHPYYSDYGGRGITFDERWCGRGGFDRFLEDMGERPTLYHSLERTETDGNYTKDNCRWATPHEQANNRRNNRIFEIGGEQLTLSQAVDKYKIRKHYFAVIKRLGRGWDILAALTIPFPKRK